MPQLEPIVASGMMEWLEGPLFHFWVCFHHCMSKFPNCSTVVSTVLVVSYEPRFVA